MLTHKVTGGPRGLNFGLSLFLHSYFGMQAARAQASLRAGADLHEPSLVDNAINCIDGIS